MSSSIQGKTAIVTGAGKGIGLAIARHFRQAGANVVFADNDERALEDELGAEMNGQGSVRGFAGDLGQKLTQANLVSATIDAFERVDILVNAHRAVQACDPMSTDEDLLSEMMRQNMTSALKLSQLVAKRMTTQAREEEPEIQAGSIINVISLAADRPQPLMLAYSIASAAQAQASRSMAMALAGQKIRVNGIAFASIMSNVMQSSLKSDPALRERLVAATPLARIAGAEELGPVAEFLASEASGFITGQILRVDGGRSLADSLTPPVF
ncbi:SDR family NAD(P)-dependent oxidoreductase [Paracoccus aminophilus]|uniref:3-ketoacyl-(Acyl-carrier-protein) reductase n=1 Tax=Paracoccus aminophilus JCM 7686 TaxID=1367847 RepID=S5YA10_PARAH|nr:SDR family oxidoreductase [Paracoccus aminophilus]AGT08228.1 3-ketoacyl-(acyl-carrier-protein) reductase [Paracoccus aminophilus JCM 7686]